MALNTKQIYWAICNYVQLMCKSCQSHRKVPRFLGVWPKDQLLSIRKDLSSDEYPVFYVANTDTSNLPGQHWVAFYWSSPKECEYFDSYGLSPDVHLMFPAEGSRVALTCNPRQVQAFDSTSCGHHCILYLISKLKGLSLQQFLSIFYPSYASLPKNDAVAKYKVSRLLKLSSSPASFIDSSNQCYCSKSQACLSRLECSCAP